MATKHNITFLSVDDYCLLVQVARMQFVVAQAMARGESLGRKKLARRFEATSATAAGIGARLG